MDKPLHEMSVPELRDFVASRADLIHTRFGCRDVRDILEADDELEDALGHLRYLESL
jgi:hypothetical protein